MEIYPVENVTAIFFYFCLDLNQRDGQVNWITSVECLYGSRSQNGRPPTRKIQKVEQGVRII